MDNHSAQCAHRKYPKQALTSTHQKEAKRRRLRNGKSKIRNGDMGATHGLADSVPNPFREHRRNHSRYDELQASSELKHDNDERHRHSKPYSSSNGE